MSGSLLPSPFASRLYSDFAEQAANTQATEIANRYAVPRNELLIAKGQQEIAQGEMEQLSRAANWLKGLKTPEDRALAYSQIVLPQLQGMGFAKNAPPTYPGDERIDWLASQGTPSADQFKLRGNTAAVQQLVGDGTTPPAAPGQRTSSTAPLAPFRYANLPTGINPDEDLITRTVIMEGGGEGTVGQQAVAHVINNRRKVGNQSVDAVLFEPFAFEPWNNAATRKRMEEISPNDPLYQKVLNEAVRPVLAGQVPDPTKGATHFFSPTAQAQLAKIDNRPLVPSWATGDPTAVIGRHNFYAPGYAPRTQVAAGPQTTATDGTTTATRPNDPDVPGPHNDWLSTRDKQALLLSAQRGVSFDKIIDDRRQIQAANRKAWEDARKQNEPFPGDAARAAAQRTLLRLMPKLQAGTITDPERLEYAAAEAEYTQPKQAVWVQDPTDPSKQMLQPVPGKLPEGFLPSTYRPGDDPKTGKPISKPVERTEAEGKAATFADRMTVALPIMQELDDITTYSQRGLEKFGKYVGYNVNSPEYQKLRAAQGAFLSAIIRKESGAGVSQKEWDDNASIYFPMPGDEAPAIALKAQLRKVYLEGMIREAGPGYKPAASIAAPPTTTTTTTSEPPPVSLLKEGINTTFDNGQTWTLQNGKPVQVK